VSTPLEELLNGHAGLAEDPEEEGSLDVAGMPGDRHGSSIARATVNAVTAALTIERKAGVEEDPFEFPRLHRG
jgi:hypothetical protein